VVDCRQQQNDEIPMVWVMLVYIYVLYSPGWNHKVSMPTLLVPYGAIFSVLHNHYQFVTGFQLHYMLLALLCAPRIYRYYTVTTNMQARRLAHQYLFCFFSTITCWYVDQILCNRQSTLPIEPEGHAIFHILNGLNSYFGNMFLQYCRAQQLGMNPHIKYIAGMLPYVKVVSKHTPTKHLAPSLYLLLF
jgi:dihydroceramidase